MQEWIDVLPALKASCTLAAVVPPTASRFWHPVIKNLFLVMVGGSLGAASRYGLGLLAARLWGAQFPWGTLIANLSGCLLIGWLFSLADRMHALTPAARLFFMTGFLGALTTFSTFALETVNAGRAGLLFQSLGNILINNIGGLALVFLGMWLGRLR